MCQWFSHLAGPRTIGGAKYGQWPRCRPGWLSHSLLSLATHNRAKAYLEVSKLLGLLLRGRGWVCYIGMNMYLDVGTQCSEKVSVRDFHSSLSWEIKHSLDSPNTQL